MAANFVGEQCAESHDREAVGVPFVDLIAWSFPQPGRWGNHAVSSVPLNVLDSLVV